MKKTIFFSIPILVFSIVLSFYASSADYGLSTGMDIIRRKIELKKCGTVNCDVYFSEDDFAKILGEFDYIQINSLPDKSSGILKLSGMEVKKGQIICKKDISSLNYCPNYKSDSSAKFTFSNPSDKSVPEALCTINMFENGNFSPSAMRAEFSTSKNISVTKFLKGADPEGDGLTFEIVRQPDNGTVRLKDSFSGCFVYTPNNNFTGRDYFSYFVTDDYGNISETAKVTINVNESLNTVNYSDLKNHWSCNSALEMSAMGLMGGEIKDGDLCFCPEKPVSRGDFLAMAMIVAGLEDSVENVYTTNFSDDSEIPYNIKGYAKYALEHNIVSGYREGDKISFCSSENITRAQACVILENLLNIKTPVVTKTFLDNSDCSEQVKKSMSALCYNNIISGTGYGYILPNEYLTKAQCAQLLCNVKDYLDNAKFQILPS